MADLAVQVATTGQAKFPDGTTLQVSPKDWLDTVKWIYAQIDGPPKSEDEIAERVDKELNALFDKITANLGESTAAQVLAAITGNGFGAVGATEDGAQEADSG